MFFQFCAYFLHFDFPPRIVTIGPALFLCFLGITFFFGSQLASKSSTNESTSTTTEDMLSNQESTSVLHITTQTSTVIATEKPCTIGCQASSQTEWRQSSTASERSTWFKAAKKMEGREDGPRSVPLGSREAASNVSTHSVRRALQAGRGIETNSEQVG